MWGTDYKAYIKHEEQLFPKVLDIQQFHLRRLKAGAQFTVGVDNTGSIILWKESLEPQQVIEPEGTHVVEAVNTPSALWALTADGKLQRLSIVNGEISSGND